MSKNMQITVTVRPYYEKSLEETYPKLSRYLKHHEYKIIQENIADWNLAKVDKLLYSIEDTFDVIESELD